MINERVYVYLKNRSGSITSKIDNKGVAGIIYALDHWKEILMNENNPMLAFLQYQYLILVMNLYKSKLLDSYSAELLTHSDLLNSCYSKTLNNKIASKIIRMFGFKGGAMILSLLYDLRRHSFATK